MAEKGHVAWDIGKYDFLLEEGQNFDSIHPACGGLLFRLQPGSLLRVL